MRFDGIIFDVDGTLWNSCEQVARIWSAAASRYVGREVVWTAERLEQEFGKTMDDIMLSLMPELSETQRTELGALCFDGENAGLLADPGILYPDVKETLQRLAWEHRLFIVSNCQKGYIEVLLESYDLWDCFEGWMCWQDTMQSKDVTIRTLMEKYGLSTAVYVGDTQGDLNACRQAGIPMIFASYGLGKADTPDWTIDSFGALEEKLQNI